MGAGLPRSERLTGPEKQQDTTQALVVRQRLIVELDEHCFLLRRVGKACDRVVRTRVDAPSLDSRWLSAVERSVRHYRYIALPAETCGVAHSAVLNTKQVTPCCQCGNINAIIEERGLTQAKAASLLDAAQPN